MKNLSIYYLTILICCTKIHTSLAQHNKSIFLEDISWTKARSILNESTTMVIPLGAAAKEHGPHLPLATDFIQANGLKKIVANECNVVITPTVSYGYYPAFIKYPGSTTTYWHTSRDMIVEIVRTLAGFGPRRFYIINVGVSTTPTLAAAAEILKSDGLLLQYSDYKRANFSKVDETFRKETYGGHADDGETSNILFLRPDLVNMSMAVNDSSAKDKAGPMTPTSLEGGTYNPSGINGYATLATKRTGKLYLQAFAKTIVDEINELNKSSLPSIKNNTESYMEYTGSYMTIEGKILKIGFDENKLYYEWNGIEKRNFFPLWSMTRDYFSSLPMNILFVRNDMSEIRKAWVQVNGETIWMNKMIHNGQ